MNTEFLHATLRRTVVLPSQRGTAKAVFDVMVAQIPDWLRREACTPCTHLMMMIEEEGALATSLTNGGEYYWLHAMRALELEPFARHLYLLEAYRNMQGELYSLDRVIPDLNIVSFQRREQFQRVTWEMIPKPMKDSILRIGFRWAKPAALTYGVLSDRMSVAA